jgi:hypothetical protein
MTSEKKDSVATEITEEQRFEKLPYNKQKVEQQMGTLLLGLHALGWSPDDEDMEISVESRKEDVMGEPTFSIIFRVNQSNSIRLQYNDVESSWHIAEAKEGRETKKHPFMGDGDSKYPDMESVLSYLDCALKFVNPEDGRWKSLAKTWEERTRATSNDDVFRAPTDAEVAISHGVNVLTMKAARAEATKLLAEYQERKKMTEIKKQSNVGDTLRRLTTALGQRMFAQIPKWRKSGPVATTTSPAEDWGLGQAAGNDDILNEFRGNTSSTVQTVLDEDLGERSVEKRNANESAMTVSEVDETESTTSDEYLAWANTGNPQQRYSQNDPFGMGGFGITTGKENVDDDYFASTPARKNTPTPDNVFEDRVTNYTADQLLTSTEYRSSFIEYLKREIGMETSYLDEHEKEFVTVLEREVLKQYKLGRNGVQRFTTALFGQRGSSMQKTRENVIESLLRTAGVEIPRKGGDSRDELDGFGE